MKNAIDFFAMVKENPSLQRRTQLAIDIETILQIAEEYSCHCTNAEFLAVLGKIPAKDLASVVNPGIGNRLHMSPR
jgi:hypothetical protein